MDTVTKYAAVFGRSPAVLLGPSGEWGVSACMFPAMKRSFWRGLWSEAHDQTVYITAGMSAHPMRCDPATSQDHAERIELMAICEVPIGGGPSGNEDVPTAILQLIANYILDNRILVAVGHTLDFQEPLATNTMMSAVLFALPEQMDVKRIRRCSKAQALLNVVPITAAELNFMRKHDLGALLDKFESAGVLPVFDFARSSAV